MARPRNPNAKPNVSIVKRKQKDGSYIVFRKTSVYDPEIKNSRTIEEVRIGTLPSNYSDLEKDLIPWVSTRKNNRTTKLSAAAKQVHDPREQSKVRYPLAESLIAIFFAVLCGCTSCLQIQAFWKLNLNSFQKLMPGFPMHAISHDTIRRFIQLLGRDERQKFFHSITSELLSQFKLRRVSIDGQAVRASSIDGHKHPYVFNAFDSDNGLVLNQTLINAKENEITRSLDLLKDLDLSNAVVTADALNTQKKFVEFLVQKKQCDYCLAMKNNHKQLHDLIAIAFSNAHVAEHESAVWEAKSANTKTNGHGRSEQRKLRVLRANLLPKEILDQWCGLEYGTIVETVTETTDNQTGETSSQTRFFISSLNFEERYIAEKMAHVIRGHWAIENQLHWNLDVCFNQDRMTCSNAEFIKGMTSLNKLALNVQNKVKEYLEENEETNYTRPMLMTYLTDIETSVELVSKIFDRNHPSEK